MPTTSATNPEYIMKAMKEQLDGKGPIFFILDFLQESAAAIIMQQCVAEELQEEYPDSKIIVIDS